MGELWGKSAEIEFFKEAEDFASPVQLFYNTPDGKYVAYWPKGYKGKKSTLQSRNSLIGNFTEKWSAALLQEFAEKNNLFAVKGVVCEEIGLTKQSPADVVICKTSETTQTSENIVAIFEVKMSVVWNWEFIKGKDLKCIGDFTTHQGNPGLLRSDSMLKAIGKSINIRVSGLGSAKIPIIVLGNTPITKTYEKKVDHLRSNGIIQGFWSVNPKPREIETLKNTESNGFIRMDTYDELMQNLAELLLEEREFFSGMKTKKQIGEAIELANKEKAYEEKAEKFLEIVRNQENGN